MTNNKNFLLFDWQLASSFIREVASVSRINLINPQEYDFVVSRLRDFFRRKNFVEVPVQHRLSILAACEDPRTIATFNYAGALWPLPQTGQMWLEYELLTKPEARGYYCISTSFRNEPDPIPGRHDLVFPMFEFETHGDMEKLIALEIELLEFLGFGNKGDFVIKEYQEIAQRYGVEELDSSHEERLLEDFGAVVFIKNFPEITSPFWNMKRNKNGSSCKVDVVLYGIETIGSAERSCDVTVMHERFHNISNGIYAELLFAQFTRERVLEELENFLRLKFITRSGGGIGITRLIRALKLHGILK